MHASTPQEASAVRLTPAVVRVLEWHRARLGPAHDAARDGDRSQLPAHFDESSDGAPGVIDRIAPADAAP